LHFSRGWHQRREKKNRNLQFLQLINYLALQPSKLE
jgi:hypothetical protein